MPTPGSTLDGAARGWWARRRAARQARSDLWRRLGRMLRLARPYRGRILGAMAIILAAAGLSLIFPLGIRLLLDAAIEKRDAGLLNLLGLGLLAIYLFRAVFAFIGRYVLELSGERMVIDLRKQLFSHLHALDHRYFSNQRVGDLTSRLTSDSAAIRNAVTETMVGAVLQGFQLVGALAVMVWLNWRLALLVLAMAPLATVISRVFAPKLRTLAKAAQAQQGQSMAIAQESISGIGLVKAFARGDYESKRFAEALRRLFERVREAALTNSLFQALVNFAASVASIAIFWYGGLKVLSGTLTAGDLVAFLFYSQSITNGVSQLAQLYGSLSFAAGSSDRVFEVLDTAPAIVEAADARRLDAVRGEIAFDDVDFGYDPDQPVLHGVSFLARPGRTVALVGLSGGGKSTVLHLLSRFYDPTSGAVRLDGVDLRELELDWLREQVALVSQDVFLFGVSVRENLRYGRLDASDEEVEAAARAAYAHDFIAALPQGYDTQIGERGVKLSGGQRQRLALARAFLKDSPILVLDEATSAVDSDAEERIRSAMDELSRDRTTLIVAHRLSSVMKADEILVIEGGRIVERGTHEQLQSAGGTYARLLRGQVLTIEEPVPSAAEA